MDLFITILFVLFITTFITIYIVDNGGLWENIEVYTPNWSEKYLIITFVYLFIIFITLSWLYNYYYLKNRSIKSLNRIIYATVLILFFFSIFCLTKNNTSPDESFIISSILLGILILNILISLVFLKISGKLFSILPLSIYLYIYIWINEIKNNY